MLVESCRQAERRIMAKVTFILVAIFITGLVIGYFVGKI